MVSAILAEALEADYWKPIQAGLDDGTDSELVRSLLSNSRSRIWPELYKLKLPASPHLAARAGGIDIQISEIAETYTRYAPANRHLVIEGAGGLLVPLGEDTLVVDLIRALDARLVLVSRNYLGSINHSLLTARVCRQEGLDVMGWVFNDSFGHYEEDIVRLSGYPGIASVGRLHEVGQQSIREKAHALKHINALI